MTGAAPLNWAVVGTGFISRSIAEDLALIPQARRYAVCSRDAVRGAAFAEELGFTRAVDRLDALLADPEVDVVYIATPHATHAAIALAALDAGKHVLIEKPIAVSAAEAATIATAAAARGRFAMEAMWMRFAPAYRSLLAEVETDALGEVRSVRASFGLPFGAPDSDRWSAERASSTLLDQGIYPVTLALDVLGTPSRIDATGTVRADGVDLAEHVTFEYPGGRFAQLGASMVEYLEPSASISGTSGWATIPAPFWAASGWELRAGSIGEALTGARAEAYERIGNGYVPMLTAVGDAIGQGWTEHPLHTLAASVEALEVLDRIRHSITTNTATAREDS
ncbi:Gfo/Idh/MocA family protein [Leifsonia sp. NPDC058194]|uniref:Gfo/Idh/MocA family protein n=1 Tax=Leifsonia sp. NPDC058194 TaxID=3346374 RepID=UPI0036DC7650